MKKEISDIEQLSAPLIWILLLVILCFIWKPATSKKQRREKAVSTIEVDHWNVLQMGTYIFN